MKTNFSSELPNRKNMQRGKGKKSIEEIKKKILTLKFNLN